MLHEAECSQEQLFLDLSLLQVVLGGLKCVETNLYAQNRSGVGSDVLNYELVMPLFFIPTNGAHVHAHTHSIRLLGRLQNM